MGSGSGADPSSPEKGTARRGELGGVAAGEEKAPGVVGVLRSGAIDTLVVDVDLAREVLALRSRA